MTNTNVSEPTSELDAADPRSHLAAAVRAATAVVDGVRPDQHDRPTPCADFDVEDLHRHMIAILRRVGAIGRGEHWETAPDTAPDVDADALAAAWSDAATACHEAWSDPAKLEAIHVLPFGEVPGAVAMAVYTAEFLIHGWDLAVSTGQRLDADPVAVQVALDAVTFGIPAEGRGPEMPFDPVVQTPDDAPVLDRLVAWVGRDPDA